MLQPPEIRHRVVECAAGTEVIEIGMPAVHETWVEHEIELPTAEFLPDRSFGGQRFVHYIAADANWTRNDSDGFEVSDTGIAAATGGLADVLVLRSSSDNHPFAAKTKGKRKIIFYFVLNGRVLLDIDGFGPNELASGDSIVLPPDRQYTAKALNDTEVLGVFI